MEGNNLEFKIQNLSLDMGETSFENMFLNTYVPMADGDSLKVFLLLYKDLKSSGEVDLEKIKRQLAFDDEKMNEIISYWTNMGVFRKKDRGDGSFYLEIISLRQAYFGNSKANVSENMLDTSKRKSVMFNQVERQDPELVTEAFRQAKEVNNVDVKYVMGFLKTWRDQSIFSLNDLKIKEERAKLMREKSPRKYKSAKKVYRSKNKNQNEKSYAQKAREERFKKILEGGDIR
ncbi:DnaD domain protein [Anaerococcus vaginalis]|uniref:DnaD domain protein n=1 Tax=Anaerococcus vaginalis TaxID=33037 RepID=UPI0029064FCC|nr:DnaD domain protein [Anaerococcus vaginalis]MDU5460599.1 DnaD domain protein [Anaerococcus vaginalis]